MGLAQGLTAHSPTLPRTGHEIHGFHHYTARCSKMSARIQSRTEQEAHQETDHFSQTLSGFVYSLRMIQAARLFFGLFPVSSASCDLPVGQIEELTLPNARSKKETWATAFGVSPEEWRSIVADVPALELRSLLEKGYTDWASHLLAEESTSLDLPLRKDKKRLQAVKSLTQAALTSSSLGEIFGNRQLVEASAAYFLLGFGEKFEAGTRQDMEMLWKLHSRFGILDLSNKKDRACTERLRRAVVEPQNLQLGRLCRCDQFWVCGENGLIRVTLSKPQRVMENPDEALDFEVVPLRGVRILEWKAPSQRYSEATAWHFSKCASDDGAHAAGTRGCSDSSVLDSFRFRTKRHDSVSRFA